MNTFIIIPTLLLIMISCYYINRSLLRKVNKEVYSWNTVNTNLLMSIIIIPSLVYWLIYIISITPPLPEEPPRWL